MITMHQLKEMMRNRAEFLGRLSERLDKEGDRRLDTYERRACREIIAYNWEEEFEWRLREYIRTGEQIELPKCEVEL